MLGRDRWRRTLGHDEVPDAEEGIVPGVGVVEEVFGVGHERRRAERVADLVHVLALEVLEHRDVADEKVVPPVRRLAGVDAPVGMRGHVVEHAVDLRLLQSVRLGLEADVGGVVGVIGVERGPSWGQDHDQAQDADGRGQPAHHRVGHPGSKGLPGVQQPSGAVERDLADEGQTDPGQQDPRQVHSHLEATEEHVAAARNDVVEGSEGGAPEGHEERHDPHRHQGPADHPGAPPPHARDDAHTDQQRDHRPTSSVVEPAGEQPREHLGGAVTVLETRALEHLVAGGPVRLFDERDDDPGRRGQRGRADHAGSPDSAPQVRGDHERPDDQGSEGEVPRLEVECHGERDEQHGRKGGPEGSQGPEGEGPGERQRPRRPELGPDPVADPDVGLGLVADPGRRRDERGDGGGGRRRPTSESEDPAAPVDGHRPQRQQEVERPAKSGVGVDHRAQGAGEH